MNGNNMEMSYGIGLFFLGGIVSVLFMGLILYVHGLEANKKEEELDQDWYHDINKFNKNLEEQQKRKKQFIE
jgi:hypothetical protein